MLYMCSVHLNRQAQGSRAAYSDGMYVSELMQGWVTVLASGKTCTNGTCNDTMHIWAMEKHVWTKNYGRVVQAAWHSLAYTLLYMCNNAGLLIL